MRNIKKRIENGVKIFYKRKTRDRNRKCGSTSFNYKLNEIYIKAHSVQRQDEELD